MLRTARIIAVGSELLTPHRIDTNSLFLTGRLNELGVAVRGKAIAGDNRAELAAWLRDAIASADLVILTGGLGPTADDITREVVAEVLGRELAEDPEILQRIRARFDRRGVPMPEINRRQSMVPAGALVLPNQHGTAPGLWLDAQDVPIILLPGPPREMKPMVDSEVMPRLAARTGARRLVTRVLKTTGRSESQIEEVAFPVYSKLGTPEIPVDTTILASPGQIELHLSAAGDEPAKLARILDDGVRQLEDALGAVVFSTDGRVLEQVVGDLLRDQQLTIAVAESCTGGLMLGRLTDIAGSSGWVLGGVVAYANTVKIGQLGVPPELIESHGAVSEAVAAAMAEGVRSRLRADVGVGITGIAGPGGATPQKPVGTVAIAVAHREMLVQTHTFPGDRDAVRRHATSAALDLVRRSVATTAP